MDLSFSKEEMAFREEVRAFFRDNVPPATRQKLVEGRHLSKQEMVDWWRILNKKGWGVSHWPKEYGGTGWTSVQHYIFNEELQMHPAPAPLAFGVSMVGPVIYTFGNEVQKKVTSKTVWVSKVTLKDGSTHTYEQEAQPAWKSGSMVRVEGRTLSPL